MQRLVNESYAYARGFACAQNGKRLTGAVRVIKYSWKADNAADAFSQLHERRPIGDR